MKDNNNTSAFNCRDIPGTGRWSLFAYPGLLHDGDAAVRVFTDHGWRWGGDWRTPKDHQHFERW
jgi:hypothetical protein